MENALATSFSETTSLAKG